MLEGTTEGVFGARSVWLSVSAVEAQASVQAVWATAQVSLADVLEEVWSDWHSLQSWIV